MTGDVLTGLIMLVVMIGAIFIGIQISFTLLFLALTFGYFSLGRVVFDLAYFQTIGMMKEELLAAVPLFIFMGFITEQAGLMERLFSALRMVLAPVRGSLYIGVILTSTVFAMATGIVGAAVTVLGIMAGPILINTANHAKLLAGRRDGARHHGGPHHDQDRLRRQAFGGRDHGRWHPRHPDSAVGDADRDGPGARRFGGRPVRRGIRPRLPAGEHLSHLPHYAQHD